MKLEPGAPDRPTRILPLVVLGALLTSSCWIEDCGGGNDCDPATQDCSLSVFCCSPPTPPSPSPGAPLGLQCRTFAGGGDDSFDLRLMIQGGAPPYRYSVDFGDGHSSQGTNAGVGLPPFSSLADHRFTRLPGTAPSTYEVRATVTDQQGASSTCALTHTVDPQRLDVDCTVAPRIGTAPLTVNFGVRATGCVGPCEFTWDFGDGETSTSHTAVHVYTSPGPTAFSTWPARGTVRDGPGREASCPRPVQVLPPSPGPGPSPGPTPTPPGNRPPVITSFTALPGVLFAGGPPAAVSATVSDPDGDTVTWTLSRDSSSLATGTFTALSGTGNVSSQFSAGLTSPSGPAVLRLTLSDGRGGTATATVTVNVVLS